MKKLLILFLAAGLLSACNNNNPFAKKDNKVKNSELEKDDRNKNDRDDQDKTYTKDDDNSNRDDTRGSWTSKDRNRWMDQCTDELASNPKAKQICSCVLGKVEQKYTDARDAENATEEEGKRLFQECMSAGTGGDAYDDNYNDRNSRDDNSGNTNNRAAWTDLQREQFIKGCAGTARQAQGFTAQQANSYCDCMTRKVEQKYSFVQAAKLTAADFQTQEWIDAAADCRPRY